MRKLKKKALTAEEVEALAEGTAAAAAGEDLGSRASREERAAARASAAGDVERERRERWVQSTAQSPGPAREGAMELQRTPLSSPVS